MKLNLDYNLIKNNNKSCIVFLHGWGMNKNCFEKVISNIERGYQILSLDFLGFGKSSEPSQYFDTYEYAYHIFVLLKKLNIEKVILVGHSFGGRIAILLSSVFDIEVEHLILTSSAGIITFDLCKLIKIINYKFKKILVKYKLLSYDYLQKCGSKDYKNCSANLKAVFVKVVNQDLQKHLSKISAKTKLVWDKKDKETPYKYCKILNKNIKNSEIKLFDTGGHFAFLYNVSKFSKIINNLQR